MIQQLLILKGLILEAQYRSEIFYLNDNQKNIAEETINKNNDRFSGKIVTKISLVKNYCTAEEYHQRYLEKR